MRVLQLIDSLHTGGAERMAVNFANSLTSHINASYICVTREEGLLKQSLLPEAHYLFLSKNTTIDVKAIKKLNSFIKRHNIDIVHAHSTSFFLGTLMKILNPKLILIWHDHHGNRAETSTFNSFVLKMCSVFFSCIIAVNDKLKKWSQDNLLVKQVYVLANFPQTSTTLKLTTLKGEVGKRIVCLANLRPDKDHINLLQAFSIVKTKHPDWTLHLVGKDYNDAYSNDIKDFIKENNLEKQVFIYGSCADISNILSQSTIGVLASKSEGLPVALLEYGVAGLPVVATNVGDCHKVISNADEGLLVEPQNHNVLAEALVACINDLDLGARVANNLQTKVLASFSESTVMKSLISIYRTHKK